MIDPRREAVLIRDRDSGHFQDRTADVSRYEIQTENGKIVIVFTSGRAYPHGQARVRILRDPTRVALAEGTRVEIRGDIWESATDVLTFAAPEGSWSRVFYRKQGKEVIPSR